MDGGGVGFAAGRIQTEDDGGCAFIQDNDDRCGGEPKPGSSYCAEHHALCHLLVGSPGEWRGLRETEALACAVGGRQGDHHRVPPDRFLRRLEKVARGLARPKRSRIVRSDGE